MATRKCRPPRPRKIYQRDARRMRLLRTAVHFCECETCRRAVQLLRRFSWAFFKASETTFNTFWRKRPILFASINHARVLPAKNRGYVHPILVLATRVEFGVCYLFWSTRVRRPVMEHHTADNTLCVESDRGSPAGRSRGWLVLTMVHRSRPDNGLANRAAQCEPIAGSKRESVSSRKRRWHVLRCRPQVEAPWPTPAPIR